VAAGRAAGKPTGKGHLSADNNNRKESMSPGDLGLLMSPSFAALQAKYGASGDSSNGTSTTAATAPGNPAATNGVAGQQQPPPCLAAGSDEEGDDSAGAGGGYMDIHSPDS
jgi:hypothetical protein